MFQSWAGLESAATIVSAGKNTIARLSQGYKSYVPARNKGLRFSCRASSEDGSDLLSGAMDGACSAMGAIAATTRAGGKVTVTSVPIRNLDFRVNVPP